MAKSKTTHAHSAKTGEMPTAIDAIDVLRGEDYYQMVSEAAYYRAEKRDFSPGREIEDWLVAEAEIQALQDENLKA